MAPWMRCSSFCAQLEQGQKGNAKTTSPGHSVGAVAHLIVGSDALKLSFPARPVETVPELVRRRRRVHAFLLHDFRHFVEQDTVFVLNLSVSVCAGTEAVWRVALLESTSRAVAFLHAPSIICSFFKLRFKCLNWRGGLLSMDDFMCLRRARWRANERSLSRAYVTLEANGSALRP